MDKLLSTLSLGSAFNILAGILGWSPQGRSLLLLSAEGPGRERIEGRTFLVNEVRDGGLIVASEDESAGGEYLLRPRHRGWTARSLMGTSIAVSVHPLTTAGAGDAISIAVARLSKGS